MTFVLCIKREISTADAQPWLTEYKKRKWKSSKNKHKYLKKNTKLKNQENTHLKKKISFAFWSFEQESHTLRNKENSVMYNFKSLIATYIPSH